MRLAALLASATAAALLLAACGGAAGGQTTTTESSAPRSGESPTAWNHVNTALKGDIREFGEEGSAAELAQATKVVRGYLIARATGNAAKACTYLSPYMLAVVRHVVRPGVRNTCARGVAQLSKVSTVEENKRPGQIEPTGLRRRGHRAFVIYTDTYGDVYAMLMRPEGGVWKIQGFEPTRLA